MLGHASAAMTLDRYDQLELDHILEELSPLFTVKTPTTRP